MLNQLLKHFRHLLFSPRTQTLDRIRCHFLPLTGEGRSALSFVDVNLAGRRHRNRRQETTSFLLEMLETRQLLSAITISNLTDTSFAEGNAATVIDSNVTFTGGTDYSDGFLKFDLTNGTVFDQLGLTSSTNPNGLGQISVSGSDVFRGNGSGRDRIGSIDAVQNGQNGQSLVINFSAPLTNSGFEDGTLGGWTYFGQEYTLVNLQGASIPYNFTNSGQGTGTGTIDVSGNPTSQNYSYSISTDVPPGGGNYSLRLSSNGSVISGPFGSNNPTGNGSLHGPYVRSSTFSAMSGDSISVDWKAQGGSDAYEVLGFLVNVGTNARTQLFAQRGDTTNWSTISGTVPANGNYQFEFICGSYDKTGGLAVGASLFLDNARIVSASAVNDATVSAIAQRVTFNNISEDPVTTTRVLRVSVESLNGMTASDTANIAINGVNDIPVITSQATNQVVAEGSQLTVVDLVTVKDLDWTDSISYTIDWGDGTPLNSGSATKDVTGFGPATPSMYSLNGTHTFADNGVYTVTIQVNDGKGGFDSTTVSVTVLNVMPTLGNVAITPTINEGDFATLAGEIIDPGTQDSFVLKVDWGDGSPVQSFVYPAGTTTFSEVHQYLDDNPTATGSDVYQVTTTIVDDDIVDDCLLFWDFENATTLSTGVSASTGSSSSAIVSGYASQTGGGPASNFGPGIGNVLPTRFFGLYSPYIEVNATSPVILQDLTFQHFHNHNPGYPTDPSYDVQLQIDTGSGFVDIGSPLNLSSSNYGTTSTIALGGISVGPGTFQIRWVPLNLNGANDTASEFFALNDLKLTTGYQATVQTTVKNVAPVLMLNAIQDIDENGKAILTGTITDPGAGRGTVIEFNGLDHSGTGVGPTVDTFVSNGFRFIGYSSVLGSGGDAMALGSIGSNSTSSYTGSAALVNRFYFGTTQIVSEDGSPFGITSLDLSESNDEPANAHRTITFIGTKSDNSQVTMTVTTDGIFGYENVQFTGFDDLVSLHWTGLSTQTDNLALSTGSGDTFTLVVDWGDPLSPNNIEQYTFGHSLTGSQDFMLMHQYLDDNPTGTSWDSYAVSVVVTDDDGGIDTSENNVSTTVLIGDNSNSDFDNANTNVFETIGAANEVSISTPGYAHAHSGTVDVFVDIHDPITDSWTQIFSQTVSSAADFYFDGLSVPFTTQSVDQVRLRSTPGQNQTFHNFGGTTITVRGVELMVAVHNVAPTIAIDAVNSVLTIDEIGAAVLCGTINDPGTLDTLTLKVNWGDPLSPDNEQTFTFDPPHTPGGGMRKFTLLHTYRDDNPGITSSDDYIITLTASDDDLGTGATTTTVTVNNLAPTATADGPDPTPAIGQPFSTDEDTPFVTGNILTNDSDPAGSFNPLRGGIDDIIKIVAINGIPAMAGDTVALPSGAILTINADGTLAYDPNNAFFYLALGQTAQDIFSYTIDDGDSGQSTANVTITVIGNNDIWVDVNNDCIYNPADGDIDVTALAEDGVFDVRYSSGSYKPVRGAGLGVNAVLDLTTNINYVADGTICILHSELSTIGTVTLVSCKQDIVVLDSVITGDSGISMTTFDGGISVNAGSQLIASGNPDADIYLYGATGTEVSGTILTAADDVTLGTGKGPGNISANGTTATATDVQMFAYGSVSAIESTLTGTSSVQLESRNSTGDISGATLTSTGTGGNVIVKTYAGLNAGPGPNSTLPATITATDTISLTASYGTLSIPGGQLTTTNAVGSISLLSKTAIAAQALHVETPGSLSLMVNPTQRNNNYHIDVSSADLMAATISIKSQDSVYANSLTAETTTGFLEIIACYGLIDVINSDLAAAGDFLLDARQGSLLATDSQILAGTSGTGSISAIGRKTLDLNGANWNSPTLIFVSALRPEDGSAGGLLSATDAVFTSPQLVIATGVDVTADRLRVNAVTKAEITSYATSYQLRSARIVAASGPVKIEGRKIDLTANGAGPALVSGSSGVSIKASYDSLLANEATIEALDSGADIQLQANLIELSQAVVRAADAVQLFAQYQVGSATNSTINLSGATVESGHSTVEVVAKGAIHANSATVSAVRLVSLDSQYSSIDADMAQLVATESASGMVKLMSQGNQNLKTSRLKADLVTIYSSNGVIDATDALFERFGDPSRLDIFAANDIFLGGSLRDHAIQSVFSSRGTVHY